MNTLLTGIKNTPLGNTYNGAVTFTTSGNDLVDLFAMIGSSRGKDISTTFSRAYSEDPEVASRILSYARDVRGGMGERQTFRDLFNKLVELDEDRALKILHLIPEIGRWDDLLSITPSKVRLAGFVMIEDALNAENALCAKWMPRKGLKAKELREFMNLSPKKYRKFIVRLSSTVEQNMCSKDWTNIDYKAVPSIAASRYSKAFEKHDLDGYTTYKDSLVKGETKINATTLLPHDIYKSLMCGGDQIIAQAQWDALPNFMGEDSGENIIALVDTSGSMGCAVGNNNKLTCMSVAVSLGLYLSERIGGDFKDHFITFSERPTLQKVRGNSIYEKMRNLESAHWQMNTNLQAAFNLILSSAVKMKTPVNEMPTKIVILSDMEFDMATGGGRYGRIPSTNFQVIEKKFKKCGYERPSLIFWNLNARSGNMPVTASEDGTALISGFSPAVMKSVLAGKDFNPLEIMLDTVMIDRYNH